MAIALSAAVTGCATDRITTGSVDRSSSQPLAQMTAQELHAATDSLGRTYTRDPRDKGVALRYGATEYAVYRSRDDAYRFTQYATFEDKSDFDRYWYGEEFSIWRADYSSWYQVPVVYGWADMLIRGGIGELDGRATVLVASGEQFPDALTLIGSGKRAGDASDTSDDSDLRRQQAGGDSEEVA
jgi:hypothetical protein